MTGDEKKPSNEGGRLTWRGRVGLVVLGLVLAVGLLAAVEGVLALFHVGDEALYDDPFVGFAPGSDLFARRTLEDGREVWATRPEKLAFFNEQSFAAEKPRDGYRVFALGGSTTAGRPYDHRVAFPRWLELYLESADPSRTWEVVNAGAISYASYRLVLLMRELVRHEPDLFVIYTGHNEFLEERTYGEILDQPETLKRLRTRLSGLRLAALVRRAVGGGDSPRERGQEAAGTTLEPEVAAKLDDWTGLDRYHRDDELTRGVLEHFEHNLRQMVRIARDHGARLVLVQPVSNVRDFSPFKSQHRADLPTPEAGRFAALLRDGREALERGDAGAAVAALRGALEIDPRHAEAHYRLGRALLAAGEPDAAHAALLTAKDEDVAPLRALEPIVAAVERVAAQESVPLIRLRDRLQADSRERFGHPSLGDAYLLDHVHPDLPVHSLVAEEALALLVADGTASPTAAWTETARRRIYDAQVARLDRRDYARRDLNLAKVLGWAGKLEEAEPPLRRAADAIPEEPEVWINLGIALQRTGRPGEALEALRRAAGLAPDWPQAHFNLGVTLGELGRLDAGVDALRRALELRPDYPEAQHNLGVLLRRRGDLEAAAVALARARELTGGAPEVDRSLGLVYRRQGRLAEAESALRRALEGQPDDAVAHTELGITLGRQGRMAEAEAELRRAVELDPGDAEAQYNLGVVLNARGAAAAAEEAFRRALALAPDHAQAHTNVGVLLGGRGELAAAQRHFEAAVEADPGSAEAHFNLGVALDGLGRGAEALATILRAVELEPDQPRFHQALAALYAARGDEERARRHARRAQALAGQPG